jgi:hypothetical protein
MATSLKEKDPKGKKPPQATKLPQIGNYIVEMHTLPLISDYVTEYEDYKTTKQRDITVSAETIDDAYYFYLLVKNEAEKKKEKKAHKS